MNHSFLRATAVPARKTNGSLYILSFIVLRSLHYLVNYFNGRMARIRQPFHTLDFISIQLSLLPSAGTWATRLQNTSGQVLYHVHSASYPERELWRCVCRSLVISTTSMTRRSVRSMTRWTAALPRRVRRVTEQSCIVSRSRCSLAQSVDSTLRSKLAPWRWVRRLRKAGGLQSCGSSSHWGWVDLVQYLATRVLHSCSSSSRWM